MGPGGRGRDGRDRGPVKSSYGGLVASMSTRGTLAKLSYWNVHQSSLEEKPWTEKEREAKREWEEKGTK